MSVRRGLRRAQRIQCMSKAVWWVITGLCSYVDKMFMRQMIKRFFSIILLVVGVQASWGFALLGPLANGGDSWQTAVIGYGLAYLDESSPFSPGGPVFLGDIGGPK